MLMGTAALLLFFNAQIAWAHKIIVFAYKEGDTVFVESKFSGGKKVKNGEVRVLDDSGQILLKGRTDGQGRFSFSHTDRTNLKIIVDAGMGHQNEWILESENQSANPSTVPVAEAPPASTSTETPNGKTAETASCCDDAEAKLEQTLDRKLKPIMQKLNRLETQRSRPSLNEILGGIGYIIGLVGLAAYLRSRKKEND
jgi:nickel transport protein